MAFDTWTPATPQLGTGFKADDVILEARFGDGYRQTLEDGPNAKFEAGELVWNGITSSELLYLRSFWATHGKATPFMWTVPDESTPRQFRFVSAFSRAQISEVRPDGSRLYTTSVSIEETFDLG